MWSCHPRREQLRVVSFDLFVSSRLPSAIIDVVELIDDFACNAASFRDGIAGLDAPLHRAGIELERLPTRSDAFCDGLCLGDP